jgi:hypothetical protein
VLTVLANDVAERRELTWLRLLSADPVRELTALSPVPGRAGDGAQGNALVGQPRSVQTGQVPTFRLRHFQAGNRDSGQVMEQDSTRSLTRVWTFKQCGACG